MTITELRTATREQLHIAALEKLGWFVLRVDSDGELWGNPIGKIGNGSFEGLPFDDNLVRRLEELLGDPLMTEDTPNRIKIRQRWSLYEMHLQPERAIGVFFYKTRHAPVETLICACLMALEEK